MTPEANELASCGELTKEQDYRLRFLGYGDPASPVWFVGMEEGGEFTEARPAAHRSVLLSGETCSFDPGLPKAERRESSVWRISRGIAQEAGLGDRYFLSNMAPFPRPAFKDTHAGVDASTYEGMVAQTRLPLLGAAFDKFKPRVVVFHGKAAWQAYRVHEFFYLAPQPDRVSVYPDEGLVFTNFFSRRFGAFSKADQDVVVTFIANRLSSQAKAVS